MTDALLLSEIRTACLARVKDNFLSLPVIGDNDGGEGLTLSSGFVHVSLSNVTPEAESVNQPILLHAYGSVVIDVNVPINTGTSVADAHCDTLATLFRLQNLTLANGNLRFNEDTSIDSGGQVRHDREGLFYQMTVVCPFYYQVYKTS